MGKLPSINTPTLSTFVKSEWFCVIWLIRIFRSYSEVWFRRWRCIFHFEFWSKYLDRHLCNLIAKTKLPTCLCFTESVIICCLFICDDVALVDANSLVEFYCSDQFSTMSKSIVITDVTTWHTTSYFTTFSLIAMRPIPCHSQRRHKMNLTSFETQCNVKSDC